jgi:polynucleotide 5'-kinase involved in rRNA processing
MCTDTPGQPLPLIVNTHGWVKGLGVPILHEIIRTAAPAMIVRLTSAVEGRNFGVQPPPISMLLCS